MGFVKIVRLRTERPRLDAADHQLAETQAALRRTYAFLRTLGHEMRNPLITHQAGVRCSKKNER